ncbi:MAG: ribonuclease P protein component [Phycisphaerales bacterium]|nr:ribonuclease P protein component [Phycisphaerales bacterium]
MNPGLPTENPEPRKAVYRARHRLIHREQFSLVYDKGLKKPAGPIVVFALENGLPHPRLGLSVGRRVGNAVKRNAVKRRLRDAFRFLAASWPDEQPGMDIVLVVRPHDVRTPAAYQSLLEGTLARISRHAKKSQDDSS